MNNKKPLVLLSMLHWGMGHVTRCFPIIHSLLELQKSILIVCTHQQKEVLAKSFNGLDFFIASDNMPKYGSNKLHTLIKLLLQAPQQFLKIRKNRLLVKRLAQKRDIELIISDNKYGFFHPQIPSVILTHQLNAQSGFGKTFDVFMNKINRYLLSKFKQVWIVDQQGDYSLAGSLSAPKEVKNTEVKWIGPLNRLQIQPQKGSKKIVIILSGPEPQRSILEKIIVNQLDKDCQNIFLIRGTTKKFNAKTQAFLQSIGFVNWLDLANQEQIETLLSNCEYVIGRSGYTSMMEWICGGWKPIVIPTPGQREQEYLGEYLMDKKWCITIPQNKFDLKKSIEKAAAFPYNINRPTAASREDIKQLIVSLLSN